MPKIKKITVSNLKAVSEQTADFNGCTAIITAGNNKGKTSFLTVFTDRMRGVIPPELLKEGTTSGGSTIELDNGERFIWEVGTKSKQGEKLTYITKDDIRFPLTKEIMKKYFPSEFDVDKFLAKSEAEQSKELQKLIGIDLTDVDARYQKAYADRTYKNRLKTDAGEPHTFDSSVGLVVMPTEDLEREILGIDSHNEKIAGVVERSGNLEDNKVKNLNQIKRLEDLISEYKAQNSDIDVKLSAGKEWLAKPENQTITEDIAAVKKTALNDIRVLNNLVIENNRLDAENKEIAKKHKDWQDADDLVKKIQKERIALIKKYDLPEGFAFTEEGINYNGKPFDKSQLSTSSLYIGALKLAYMGIGTVKTIHFDASYLDNNSLKEVEEWAKSKDLQLLIERPDMDGGEITYELRTV